MIAVGAIGEQVDTGHHSLSDAGNDVRDDVMGDMVISDDDLLGDEEELGDVEDEKGTLGDDTLALMPRAETEETIEVSMQVQGESHRLRKSCRVEERASRENARSEQKRKFSGPMWGLAEERCESWLKWPKHQERGQYVCFGFDFVMLGTVEPCVSPFFVTLGFFGNDNKTDGIPYDMILSIHGDIELVYVRWSGFLRIAFVLVVLSYHAQFPRVISGLKGHWCMGWTECIGIQRSLGGFRCRDDAVEGDRRILCLRNQGNRWENSNIHVQFHFGYDRVFTVDPCGASGGLALFYNNSYDVSIICSNKRIIDVEASHEGRSIFMSFVYGDSVVKFRDIVWERITRIGTTRTEPWFLIGDFNEITGNHEKQGGALRQASTFVPFNLMISDCDLVDFPSRGNTLSWRGRRRGKIVRCRLDRALATEEWHDLFPVSYVEYLPMIGSDHMPILATLDSKVTEAISV
ncbi:unnamed protein product [Microthlaspi erraticum]|uniref:Endonuclease/exonuclease/phosphatase domain-containing protein n=1 Tax=Microthlaspi erraticum TaxID=1685480 RepID=A0A6D2KKA5_9BRAS|nr:unnamed protein product [Microthlaspi erraticum]